MFKNKTISDLDIELQGTGNSFKKHLLAKIGIIIVEFWLSSVLYCYSVISWEYVNLGSHKYKDGIFAAILFSCCWNFTNPISRFIIEYFRDSKYKFFRYLLGGSTAVLFFSIMIRSPFYMILAGILSNLISTQISTFAIEKLNMDSRIFEAIRQVVRAISLFLTPHLIFSLINNYEIEQAKLIYASILLNMIPATLLIKAKENSPKKYSGMARYETIGRYNNSINEMKCFNMEENKYDSSSTSSDEACFENSDGQSIYFENNHKTYNLFETDDIFQKQQRFNTSLEYVAEKLFRSSTILTPVNLQSYYHNAGVSILPGIPEESEDECENANITQPKRSSKIYFNLQDPTRKSSTTVFNINQVTEIRKPEPIDKIEYMPNFKQNNKISVMHELKHFHTSKRCCGCSPYKRHVWTRRYRMLKDFLVDNFLRPTYHAVKNMFFYPALTTKIVTNLLSTLYITLTPFIGMQRSWKHNLLLDTENATFLLTYVAFAWCFFLVTIPLIFKLSDAKIRIIFTTGLVICGTSFWILSGKITNDVITISNLFFGFGYGIITYTEKIVFRSSIGSRPWYLVRGPLEILSAIFIIIIYYMILMYRLNLKYLLFWAAFSFYFNAVMWLCLPVISYVKRWICNQRNRHESFFH